MEENQETTEKKVRSSFTMAKSLMTGLKAKAEAEKTSVSALIEKAVVNLLAQ